MAKQSGTKWKYKRWNILIEWNQGGEVAACSFCFTSLFEERSGISCSWVNEKWIVQKMNSLLWLYITVIEQCLLIHKKEKSELSVTEWHGHVWLPKKLVWTTNKAVLGGLLPTFMHRFGWWNFVHFITKPWYTWRKMVFISHGQDVLWSQEVCWKCIFQGSGDPNIKVSSFTAHHGGASGDTDLANSKETQSLRKNGCRQKCLDKSLVWLERTPGVN